MTNDNGWCRRLIEEVISRFWTLGWVEESLIPAVLEIPVTGHPYDVHRDSILKYADFVPIEEYVP